MRLRARRLTARQVLLLMEDYFAAMGVVAMDRAFGWKEPHDAVKSGEHNSSVRFWEFRDADYPGLRGREEFGGARVAWAKMHLSMLDPDDDEAVVSRGVWPGVQHCGYGKAVLAWLARKASMLGASHLTRCVCRENAEVYRRSLAEAMDPKSPWVWSGAVWYPTQYDWFMMPLRSEPALPKPFPPGLPGGVLP